MEETFRDALCHRCFYGEAIMIVSIQAWSFIFLF